MGHAWGGLAVDWTLSLRNSGSFCCCPAPFFRFQNPRATPSSGQREAAAGVSRRQHSHPAFSFTPLKTSCRFGPFFLSAVKTSESNFRGSDKEISDIPWDTHSRRQVEADRTTAVRDPSKSCQDRRRHERRLQRGLGLRAKKCGPNR